MLRKIICWLFGCDDRPDWDEGSWYCSRCGATGFYAPREEE